MAAKMISADTRIIAGCLNKCHEDEVSIIAILRIIATSPIRLVKAVMRPAPTEYEFW